MAKTTAQAKAEGEIAELIDKLGKLVVDGLDTELASKLYDAAKGLSEKLKVLKHKKLLDAYNEAKAEAEKEGLLTTEKVKEKKAGGAKAAGKTFSGTVAEVKKFLKENAKEDGGVAVRALSTGLGKTDWNIFFEENPIATAKRDKTGKATWFLKD